MAPDGDVAAALTPCPPDFPGMSVRAVRAKNWPSKTCFAIIGHLSATYAEGSICNRRLAMKGAPTPGASSPAPRSGEIPRCATGWVLTDLSDPIRIREDELASQPFIRVHTPAYMRWMDALFACNRDSDGKPILPARARFRLPPTIHMDAIPRLNADLAGVTVGVFGGVQSCCGMADVPDGFDSMMITHICRVDAPDGGTRRD